MGLFTRKPDRGLKAELEKQAVGALNIFGHALQMKKTNAPAGKEHEAIDLTIEENRDAIRNEIVRVIHDYGLEGCKESEIGGARLMPIVMDQSKSPITDAAVCSALAINSINLITRNYYENFPDYKPLHDMVDKLAKTCCTGAAQTIGSNLPYEVVRTWPYFSRIFSEAKISLIWLWPDV
jgi:hypothetical protein